jgi:hypothetical protein
MGIKILAHRKAICQAAISLSQSNSFQEYDNMDRLDSQENSEESIAFQAAVAQWRMSVADGPIEIIRESQDGSGYSRKVSSLRQSIQLTRTEILKRPDTADSCTDQEVDPEHQVFRIDIIHI